MSCNRLLLHTLPIGFTVLDLAKQIRVALQPPDFLCVSISQTPILGPEFIILGFPCVQQGFIRQI